jgi:phospholipase C
MVEREEGMRLSTARVVLLTLTGAFVATCGFAPGCSETTSPAPEAQAEDAAGELLRPPPIERTETEAALAAKRKACGFARGAWPAQTIGKEHPLGSDIPINHVIVIMQENRSFDSYLGRLVAQGYYQAGDFGENGEGFEHSDQVDVPPPGWGNRDANGALVTPHPDTENCYGVNHGWDDMHDQVNGGRMDRYVLNNDPNGQRAFYYQDDSVIPFYYALANTFAIGDRYFCSVLSSTWPNRLYMMAATSFGIGDNSFVTTDTAEHPEPNLFAQLEAAGRTWKDYTDAPHQVLFFPHFGWRTKSIREHYGNMKCDLFNDIRNGTLPDVSFVMGNSITHTNDEGPSALPGIGGRYVEEIIRALFASKSWKDTAVFITYDENGGLADHVPPAPACAPDDRAPHDEKGRPLKGAFDTTGARVPFIVVSPYTKKHFVSHQVYDHTSVVRFIAARFGLPALSARDANATPPMEMFDFRNPPFATPPDIKATTTVDPAVLARCGQKMMTPSCD